MSGLMDEVRPRAACDRPANFCMRVHAETRLAGDLREKESRHGLKIMMLLADKTAVKRWSTLA